MKEALLDQVANPLPEVSPQPHPSIRKILLVEDHELVAYSIQVVLRTKGYDVRRVANGSAAWRLLSKGLEEFDLVLTDLNMPLMHGDELIGLLRQHQYKGKIFLITSELDPLELRHIKSLKVDQILFKPIKPNEILSAISQQQ
ncbi:MAG: response regulator [Verrucomicrobiae bacterium]|nr:response regulator [Verrucomicrobiae bacterium]